MADLNARALRRTCAIIVAPLLLEAGCAGRTNLPPASPAQVPSSSNAAARGGAVDWGTYFTVDLSLAAGTKSRHEMFCIPSSCTGYKDGDPELTESSHDTLKDKGDLAKYSLYLASALGAAQFMNAIGIRGDASSELNLATGSQDRIDVLSRTLRKVTLSESLTVTPGKVTVNCSPSYGQSAIADSLEVSFNKGLVVDGECYNGAFKWYIGSNPNGKAGTKATRKVSVAVPAETDLTLDVDDATTIIPPTGSVILSPSYCFTIHAPKNVTIKSQSKHDYSRC